MPVIALLGAQWGDEGKGKGVDSVSALMDIAARFQGGPNAGHTLVVNGRKVVLHQVPSGILHPNCKCLLGNGMVIDFVKLAQEICGLETIAGSDVSERIYIARNAHLLLPIHQLIDALMDKDDRIGTTKSGIGPAYADKKHRVGLQVSDILLPNFKQKVVDHIAGHIERNPCLKNELRHAGKFEEIIQDFFAACEHLRPRICDGVDLVNTALKNGGVVLAEGAQGTLLDINQGTYPFVTSSDTTIGGVCTGLGVPASAITRVIGVAKAYTTRVGTGPFPTELHDEIGVLLQKRGEERGATTGRERRCGWFDMPLMKWAHSVNGFTEMWLTKLDILDTLAEIQVCTGYATDGRPVKASQVINCLEAVTPHYLPLPGWQQEIREARTFKELPRAAQEYVGFIQDSIGVAITRIGTGPDRVHCIDR